MASSSTHPELPAVIDRYQIRAFLGGGTFGNVYRAFDPRLDREVALKVLRPEMTTSTQAVERFLREAKAAAKLFHPHIVPVYDAGRAGKEFYIASAFIQGKTLAAAIPEGGMEVHRAVEVAVQLALALGYAHRQGVLHRDVKPQNIMVDEQGSLYLMDFGLAAWVLEEGTRLTQEGAMLGTPAYMSPEQASGDNEKVGPAADLYSAGVVLYELLTGRRPFEGHTAALVFQVMSKAAPPPSRHRPGLDAGLDAVCLRVLAKDPAERYCNGEDMAAALRGQPLPDLQSKVSGATLPAARPHSRLQTPKNDRTPSGYSSQTNPGSSPPAATVRPRRRSRLPWMLAGLATLCVLAILAGVAVVFKLLPRAGQVPEDKSVVHNEPPPVAPAAPTGSPPATEATASGKVVGVEEDRLTFTAEGKERTVIVPAGATILIDGKDGKFADIKKDSSMTLTMRADVATNIAVTSPAPAPPKVTMAAGKVVGVDKDKLTVRVDDGERTFTVPATAKVTIDDKDGELGEVRKNSTVSITSKGDIVVAVETTSPPPPVPAKAPFDAAEAKRLQQAWADYLGVPVEREVNLGDGVTMKLRLIPPGRFTMGSPNDEAGRFTDEGPQHPVEITKSFYLGTFAVRRRQFAAFVKDAGYQTEAEKPGDVATWRNPGFTSNTQTDNDPVVDVSWNDAVRFCEWLSKKEGKTYELPTEAEWEYACRAGTTTAYSFGDDPAKLDDYAWYRDNSGGRNTHPVGTKKPNPWGLYDMHGDVWQWCADYYDKDYAGPIKDPQGVNSGKFRVLRGGSWNDDPGHCRSADRFNVAPANCGANCGFRVVLRPAPRTP